VATELACLPRHRHSQLGAAALAVLIRGAAHPRLVLGVLCSAIAPPIFFRLIADVGPSRALTVTFLIPAFAMLWSRIFLSETITSTMLIGTLAIIGGTLLVAGWSSLPAVIPTSTAAVPVPASD
jgi:uncharacterized membrane protein